MNLKQSPHGVLLQVKVTPKAKRERIVGWENGLLKVHVSAPPEKGEANDRLLRVLADRLGLAKSHLTLITGHTSRQKTVLITGMALEQIAELLIDEYLDR
jgi:uncharacterized protein (TIGR00251 family)